MDNPIKIHSRLLQAFAFSLGVASLVLVGCAEPMPTGNMVDQSLTGSWVLDRDETLRRQIKVLKEKGIVNIVQDEIDYKRSFAATRLNFELDQDAEFNCYMSSDLQSGNYSGYWKTNDGNFVSLVQTHEDGKPRRDVMNGIYDEMHMYLTHTQNDIALPYVLIKVQSEETTN